MPPFDINSMRLDNQHLAAPQFTRPAALVAWLGAVQAQDYGGANWAIGQRLQGAMAETIDKALNSGEIIRTHVLRPTWHIVAPGDVRWMLELTAKRIRMQTATRLRFMELNEKIFAKCAAIVVGLLEGGKQTDRTKIAAAFRDGGIATNELRLIHILLELELRQLICSGGREGKQLTYALMDDRVPPAKRLSNDEALATLAKRYFFSHGPATLHDFAWWAGLTLEDCKKGIEACAKTLEYTVMNNKRYWFGAETGGFAKPARALLLPNYDEYIVSYKDRQSTIDPKNINKADPRGTLFNNTLVLRGKIAGTWKRDIRKTALTIEIKPFKRLNKAEAGLTSAAAKRYARFLGLKAAELAFT